MTRTAPFFRLLKDRSGNTLIISALTLTSLVGAVGLGTDTVQWDLWKRQLQREADSAAIAGAQANYLGASGTDAATTELHRYNYITLTKTPTIEVGPTSGPYAGNSLAVRVVVQSSRSLPFSSIFLTNAPVIIAQATAAATNLGTYCVVSLENTTATGITFQGSASANLGCGIATNSQGTSAVYAGGASTVNASPVAAVGAIPASSSYASGTTLQPYSSPQADPFASLPPPVVPSGCNSPLQVQPNRTAHVTNPTGTACFSGMDIKGTVTFDPGVYYINGGSFNAG
ncbi:MAG: Tad domain-containing protein, partial [Sphingomonadales bacterium]|nr:Tad domain-containing protein [Sphingomonadales bacterium]